MVTGCVNSEKTTSTAHKTVQVIVAMIYACLSMARTHKTAHQIAVLVSAVTTCARVWKTGKTVNTTAQLTVVTVYAWWGSVRRIATVLSTARRTAVTESAALVKL